MFLYQSEFLCYAESCLLSSDRILVLFFIIFIFSAHPIVHRPFPIFSTNFTSLTLFIHFSLKLCKTECSCSASRIGTLCFTIFISSNFAHTTTFEPVLLFRLLSLLPKVKTDGSLAERKQKGEVRFRFTPFSLHHLLSDGPTIVPSLVSIFPLLLVLTILP